MRLYGMVASLADPDFAREDDLINGRITVERCGVLPREEANDE
jgi:hypothetical protein